VSFHQCGCLPFNEKCSLYCGHRGEAPEICAGLDFIRVPMQPFARSGRHRLSGREMEHTQHQRGQPISYRRSCGHCPIRSILFFSSPRGREPPNVTNTVLFPAAIEYNRSAQTCRHATILYAKSPGRRPWVNGCIGPAVRPVSRILFRHAKQSEISVLVLWSLSLALNHIVGADGVLLSSVCRKNSKNQNFAGVTEVTIPGQPSI